MSGVSGLFFFSGPERQRFTVDSCLWSWPFISTMEDSRSLMAFITWRRSWGLGDMGLGMTAFLVLFEVPLGFTRSLGAGEGIDLLVTWIAGIGLLLSLDGEGGSESESELALADEESDSECSKAGSGWSLSSSEGTILVGSYLRDADRMSIRYCFLILADERGCRGILRRFSSFLTLASQVLPIRNLISSRGRSPPLVQADVRACLFLPTFVLLVHGR